MPFQTFSILGDVEQLLDVLAGPLDGDVVAHDVRTDGALDHAGHKEHGFAAQPGRPLQGVGVQLDGLAADGRVVARRVEAPAHPAGQRLDHQPRCVDLFANGLALGLGGGRGQHPVGADAQLHAGKPGLLDYRQCLIDRRLAGQTVFGRPIADAFDHVGTLTPSDDLVILQCNAKLSPSSPGVNEASIRYGWPK